MTPIEGHKFCEFVVGLCVECYAMFHCGFRSVSQLVSYLDKKLKWGLEGVPCANTIENWVKKSGYHIYTQESRSGADQQQDYAAVIDESIMLGNAKTMLVLGHPAQRSSSEPLKYSDMSVLDMSASPSWNAEKISSLLAQTIQRQGKAPLYATSDNDAKLFKALRETSCVQIRDISHTLALHVKRLFKDDADFKALTKKIGAIKNSDAMRPTRYLLPPRQRAIARFMNLAPTLDWLARMRKAFPSLDAREQKSFAFVKQHVKTTAQLEQIFGFITAAETLVKTSGLSKRAIRSLLEMMDAHLTLNTEKIKRFKKSVRAYLMEESEKLPSEETVWNASSDIIESFFGVYKSRRSPDPLVGVTPHILLLPVLTRIEDGKIDFKAALEGVFLKDVKAWGAANLSENQAIKRKAMLSA